MVLLIDIQRCMINVHGGLCVDVKPWQIMWEVETLNVKIQGNVAASNSC